MYVLQQPAITEMNASDGPYAVILAPTRELAQQIHRETLKLSKYLSRVRCVTFVGGTSAEAQGFLLRDGVEIVIATPGRLIANLKQRYIVLNQCRYLVLDEADRMMNMGFEEQVTEIIEAMPPQSDRLTFMFSATMPIKVESLVRNHLNDPVYVAIGDRHGSIVDRIDQRFEFLTSGAKESKLVEVLNEEEPPIIVFCSSRKRCEIIARALSSYGFSVITLHSDKNQQQREVSKLWFSPRHNI